MSRKRHTPEQIIGKLREAEVGLASGHTVPEVCRTLGVAEQHDSTGGPHSAPGNRPPATPAFAIDGLQPDQPFPITVLGLT